MILSSDDRYDPGVSSEGPLTNADVSVEFPLRGEWVAENSPGDRVPSHGTDALAQRYAYDFIRVDRRPGLHVHPGGVMGNLIGFPVTEAYGWGQPIHMPFDGEIIEAADGHREPARVVPIREMASALRNALTFDARGSLQPIIGNHVIARSGELYAAFVHLTTGSVAVRPGQPVRTGDLIGRVGHTGNSTAPHLHFQLQDGPDPRTARGVPCAFRELEVERDGQWVRRTDHVPRGKERIRFGADV